MGVSFVKHALSRVDNLGVQRDFEAHRNGTRDTSRRVSYAGVFILRSLMLTTTILTFPSQSASPGDVMNVLASDISARKAD